LRAQHRLRAPPGKIGTSLANQSPELKRTLGREIIMGLPNKDEVEGKWDQAKGAVKENVGHAIDDADLEAEGQADRASGNVQEGYGTARRKVGEVVEDIGEAIKR
jgi:uncharacterized protein YjbJ (UPF0337 family)